MSFLVIPNLHKFEKSLEKNWTGLFHMNIDAFVEHVWQLNPLKWQHVVYIMTSNHSWNKKSISQKLYFELTNLELQIDHDISACQGL